MSCNDNDNNNNNNNNNKYVFSAIIKKGLFYLFDTCKFIVNENILFMILKIIVYWYWKVQNI